MAKTLEIELLESLDKTLKNALGGCGSTLIDDTANHTGNWYCVIAQESSEFDVSGCTTSITGFPTGSDDFVVTSGVVLYGSWSAIELNSGSVLAFERC